jgi:UDP-glucose 4-epimerase
VYIGAAPKHKPTKINSIDASCSFAYHLEPGALHGMKHYLITGGAGFIGSHLGEELLRRGEAVHVIDDLSTGSIRNIDPLKDTAKFSYTIGSVTDVPLMAELIDRADAVFHLAAAVGVKLIFDNPTRTIQTNIRGAEVIFELAARKKKKVLLASSSEVYGKGVRIPLAETDDLLFGSTTCPRWAYACSKAIDEFLALAYWKEQKSPSVIARFFNTVGPRQTGQYGMVIPRFIRQALANEPITVYGDGSQTRCFGHVHDIVRAIIELMEHPATAGEVFNVGNDEEISIRRLAELVIEATGSRSQIRLVPFNEAFGPDFEDMNRRVPNLAKLRSLIEWKNLRGIREILDSTIAHIRSDERQRV